MIRPLYIGMLMFAVTLTFGLYSMKYEVQRLEMQLYSQKKHFIAEQEAIRVLELEWSYLNSPARLQKLASAYLELSPSLIHKRTELAWLPLRENQEKLGEKITENLRFTPQIKFSVFQNTYRGQ